MLSVIINQTWEKKGMQKGKAFSLDEHPKNANLAATFLDKIRKKYWVFYASKLQQGTLF